MNGENLGGPAPEATTPAPNPWQALENYRESTPVTPKTEADILSTAKNTTERTENKARNFINGWQTRRAKLRAEQLNNNAIANDEKIRDIQSDIDKASKNLEETFSPQEAKKLNEAILSLKTEKHAQETEMSDLRAQNTIGKYVKTQANQVEAILKSEADVVKKSLRAFAAKIITKLPKIKISVKTSENIANENWQENIKQMGAERQEAKDKLESAREVQKQFEEAKETRANAIEGISQNKKARTERFEKIANLKKEMIANRENLKNAISEQDSLTSDYNAAQQHIDNLTESLKQAKNKQEVIISKKSEVDEKIESLKERSENLAKMAEFQKAIDNRSPQIMRQNLKKELANLENQKQEKLEDLLFMKNTDSIDELSPDDAERIEKILARRYDSKMNSINEQLTTLDEYEKLRKEQSNRIFSNSTTKRGLRGAFAKIRTSLFIPATK